jgi:hypothetical protein
MGRRPLPQVTITHHNVEPPKYSKEELSGLKDQALRLEKHIDILEEEIKIKKAELIGIRSIINPSLRST